MSDVVIVGLGQLGSVFAHALLRSGHSVHAINRGDRPAELAERIPHPALVLVCVGEKDLDATIESLPAAYRSQIALVQNGLLPVDWEKHELTPTVAVVWFEKKKTIATNVILPTPIAGPNAALLVDALASIDIAAEAITGEALVDALVIKNLYIATLNLAGLATEPGITVGALWSSHRPLIDDLSADVLSLQEAILGRKVDREALMEGLQQAIAGDPDHGAKGRSAPARLASALRDSARLGVDTPAIDALAHRTSG